MVSVALPFAEADADIVAVRSSELTPLNVPPALLLGLLLTMRFNPLTVLEVRSAVAPVPPLSLAVRSVKLKPVGAVSVKLSVFDAPARADKSNVSLTPPLSTPDVIGVTVTPSANVPDSDVEAKTKTFPLTLHPVAPKPMAFVKLPVTQGLARLAVGMTKSASPIKSNFRIPYSPIRRHL